jgi:hypothetical protein
MRSFLTILRERAADLRLAMCRLNAIQFSAPWNPQRSNCG